MEIFLQGTLIFKANLVYFLQQPSGVALITQFPVRVRLGLKYKQSENSFTFHFQKYVAAIALCKKAGKSAHFVVWLQDRKAFMSCKH